MGEWRGNNTYQGFKWSWPNFSTCGLWTVLLKSFRWLSQQSFRATLYKSHPPPRASVFSYLHEGDNTYTMGSL